MRLTLTLSYRPVKLPVYPGINAANSHPVANILCTNRRPLRRNTLRVDMNRATADDSPVTMD